MPTTNRGLPTTAMTWIKICGITNLEDALVAVEAGADALGFVFYEKSPRYVHPQTIRDLVPLFPESIEKVGVFVGQDINARVVHQARLTAVQLHSTASSLQNHRLTNVTNHSKKFFFAISADQLLGSRIGGHNWRIKAKRLIDAILLDSRTPEAPGGTGIAFDWRKVEPVAAVMRRDFKLILAGGLTHQNVAEAMSILHPWGVDVSSGVEERPGKKDPAKVRAFIRAVREADKASSN